MNKNNKSFTIAFKNDLTILILAFAIVFSFSLSLSNPANAQYWAAMPPYNILWPLWSPVLSPLDPVTGLSTPLISSLTKNTLLPVQPALVWDAWQPNVESFPWLVYNTPASFGSNLVYYDVYYGINPWPPSHLLDAVTGNPLPIALPLGWSILSPISLSHFEWFLPLGNAFFSLLYGVPLSGLLTTADIWGFTPLAALPSPIL